MPDSRKPAVAIVDYGMGNLYSVERACVSAGMAARITDQPADVLAADAVVLPGVGAMPDAMQTLCTTGLADALRSSIDGGKPFLGICLGMQLLMRHGTEFREHEGLGIIAGRVKRFPTVDADGVLLRVPHIGWDAVHTKNTKSWKDTPLTDVSDGAFMYFVHSFFVAPDDDAVVLAESEYGGVRFCSALRQGNVFACQFHPERSGEVGLRVYRRFAESIAQNRLSQGV